MRTVNLSAMKPGDTGEIIHLTAPEALIGRLSALGIRLGQRIHLVRLACFKGPLHVRIGSTDIILRRKDAQSIDVMLPV